MPRQNSAFVSDVETNEVASNGICSNEVAVTGFMGQREGEDGVVLRYYPRKKAESPPKEAYWIHRDIQKRWQSCLIDIKLTASNVGGGDTENVQRYFKGAGDSFLHYTSPHDIAVDLGLVHYDPEKSGACLGTLWYAVRCG